MKKSFDFAVDDHTFSSHVIGPRDKINKAVHILFLLTQMLVAHNRWRKWVQIILNQIVFGFSRHNIDKNVEWCMEEVI